MKNVSALIISRVADIFRQYTGFLSRQNLFVTCLFVIGNLPMGNAFADGVVVDKVYHPYVLPNEQEVEWRLLSNQRDTSSKAAQSFAYGFSISENVMVETYLIGERSGDDGNFDLTAYEVAVRWMLTEQGQYWADWGVLWELEKTHQKNDWEFTTGLLVEKEFGQTSLTMNLFLLYEWGETLPTDLESEFRLKYRYRWSPQLQPSIEFYTGQNYMGIGPGFMGVQRFDKHKQLKWEIAFIEGLDNESENHIIRMAIEYEF